MHHHELTAAPTHTGSTYPPASGYAYEVHLSIPPDRQRTYSFAHTLHSSAHTHTRMHTRARTQVHTQTHTTRVVHAPASRPHRAHQQRGQQRDDQLPVYRHLMCWIAMMPSSTPSTSVLIMVTAPYTCAQHAGRESACTSCAQYNTQALHMHQSYETPARPPTHSDAPKVPLMHGLSHTATHSHKSDICIWSR